MPDLSPSRPEPQIRNTRSESEHNLFFYRIRDYSGRLNFFSGFGRVWVTHLTSLAPTMVKKEYSAKLYLSISKWISHNNWQKINIKKAKHLQSFARIATNCARQCNVKKFILARIRCMIRFDIHSLEHQTNIGKL